MPTETNTLVKITMASLVLVTNWHSIGTFTDKSGRHYDVLQSSLMTNTVGRMEAEGQVVEHTFKKVQGPTNDALRLVPIATQGTLVNATPPLPINPRFVYANEVVVPATNLTITTNPPPR